MAYINGASEEDRQRKLGAWLALLMLILLLLGAWGMGHLLPTIVSQDEITAIERARCFGCHSYLVVADQKFAAAYPEFKPISPWSTPNYHPVVLSSIPNKWYRLYAKGTFELGGRRYDAVVKVVPLLDGRVAVNTYDPSQRTIAILP